MRISEFIARTITQRSRLVWASLALLTGACLAILITSLRLDSEIFNVLPGRFSSVQGLKIYDREFEQTHELTFALLCTPQDVDKLENFAPVFAEKLRKQPWCTRVLAGSPMATPDGIRDLQSIAVPLLLNLEPSVFDETISILHRTKFRIGSIACVNRSKELRRDQNSSFPSTRSVSLRQRSNLLQKTPRLNKNNRLRRRMGPCVFSLQ